MRLHAKVLDGTAAIPFHSDAMRAELLPVTLPRRTRELLATWHPRSAFAQVGHDVAVALSRVPFPITLSIAMIDDIGARSPAGNRRCSAFFR